MLRVIIPRGHGGLEQTIRQLARMSRINTNPKKVTASKPEKKQPHQSSRECERRNRQAARLGKKYWMTAEGETP